jgi:hypothetical protein
VIGAIGNSINQIIPTIQARICRLAIVLAKQIAGAINANFHLTIQLQKQEVKAIQQGNTNLARSLAQMIKWLDAMRDMLSDVELRLLNYGIGCFG